MKSVQGHPEFARNDYGFIVSTDNAKHNSRRIIKMQQAKISNLEYRISKIERLIEGKF